MLETTVLLRQMLYQCKIAEDIEDVENAVTAMCTKDDITAVEAEVQKYKARKAAKGK